jgi:cytochrome c biogenesis protein CcmG, thiol:disulfide interchange protein DsbE
VSEVAGPAPKGKVAPFVALAVAAVLVGLFWLLAGSDTGSTTTANSFLIGKPAPAVVTTNLDGDSFDLSRRKGSWVVLNFFNSTCVPCKAEHPDLVEFREQQAQIAGGAELYTVINDDSDEAVRSWFAERGGDWPILKDDNGSIAVAFGVAKVPETWVIDPSGIVQARYAGVTTAEALGTLIQQLRISQGG